LADGSTQDISRPYTIQIRTKIKTITFRDNKVNLNLQELNKIPSDHWPQEVEEEEGVLEEDSTFNQGKCSAFSVESTRGIQLEPVKSQSRSGRKLPKLKHEIINQSRSFTPLRTIPHTIQNMFATNSQVHNPRVSCFGKSLFGSMDFASAIYTSTFIISATTSRTTLDPEQFSA
jgi:hypothetical protein